MRKPLLVLAVMVVSCGEAIGGGWPGQPPARVCAPAPTCAGCSDDSPLYGNLTWLSFQHSQCKQPCFTKSRGKSCGVQTFPPLPYSHQAYGYQPGLQSSPWNAAPAPAPASARS